MLISQQWDVVLQTSTLATPRPEDSRWRSDGLLGAKGCLAACVFSRRMEQNKGSQISAGEGECRGQGINAPVSLSSHWTNATGNRGLGALQAVHTGKQHSQGTHKTGGESWWVHLEVEKDDVHCIMHSIIWNQKKMNKQIFK